MNWGDEAAQAMIEQAKKNKPGLANKVGSLRESEDEHIGLMYRAGQGDKTAHSMPTNSEVVDSVAKEQDNRTKDQDTPLMNMVRLGDRHQGKKLILLGIDFDREARDIAGCDSETME